MPALDEKQNITLCLSRHTLRQARILAARRDTSVSALLTSELERLASEEEAYSHAQARALARLETGFHMGGVHKLDRDALHER